MTRIFAVAALLAVTACAAPPSQTTSASASASPQAPATPGMTEPQARMHVMNSGYSNVSAFTKDGEGMWRGNGVKGGQTVFFTVDPQGKIAAR